MLVELSTKFSIGDKVRSGENPGRVIAVQVAFDKKGGPYIRYEVAYGWRYGTIYADIPEDELEAVDG